MSVTVNNINILFQNYRGIRTKSREFFNKTSLLEYDIFCGVETWLPNSFVSSNYFPDCYEVYRHDRDYDNNTVDFGGGVITSVKKNGFKIKRRYDLETWKESVFLEISDSKQFKFLLGNLYVAPNADHLQFSSYCDFLENKLSTYGHKILIVGDFNAHGVNWHLGTTDNVDHYYAKKRGEKLVQLSKSLGLYQLNNVQSNNRLLDLVFTNFCNIEVGKASPVVSEDKYHSALEISLQRLALDLQSTEQTSYRMYSKGDYCGLYNFLKDEDWTEIYNLRDVDAAVNLFNGKINTAIETFIPVCSSRRKNKFPHWFSAGTIFLLRKKESYHSKYQASKSDEDRANYSHFRTRFKASKDKDWSDWLHFINTSLKAEPKKFWKFINRSRKEEQTDYVLEKNGEYISEPNTCAHIFAEHFQDTFSPATPAGTDPSSSLPNILDIPKISVDQVLKATQSLSSSKSVGVDGIPGFILKGCKDILAPVLTHIFNISIQSGIFPSTWKTSIIIPIHKSGNKTSPQNYRPISLLSSVSKIFEKVIHTHISFHLSSVLSDSQHGFISNRSTVSNLATFMNFTGKAVTSRKQVDSVYFDLSKAFDRVSKTTLIHKLQAYGFSEKYVTWFNSYLSLRTYQVKVSNSLSDKYPVLSGVPQGSILGPILFLIFINDITSAINHAHVLLFADDIKIYLAINIPADCLKLQADINSIFSWCNHNGMSINVNKTSVVSFTRKTDKLTWLYTLNNQPILRKDVVSDLGVLLDSQLRFHHQVEKVFAAASKSLGMASYITKDLQGIDAFKVLYTSLVRPKLEYASVIWNFLTVADCAKLESIQHKFLRKCAFRLHCEYLDYEDMEKYLKIQTLEHRRRVSDALFVYNVFCGKIYCPSMLHSVGIPTPTLALRHQRHFYCSSLSMLCPNARAVAAANHIFNDSKSTLRTNIKIADLT